MRDYGLPVSAVLHVLLLGAMIFVLPSAQPLDVPPEIAVDVVSQAEVDAMMKGVQNAPQQAQSSASTDQSASQNDNNTADTQQQQAQTPPQPPQRDVPDNQVADDSAPPPPPSRPVKVPTPPVQPKDTAADSQALAKLAQEASAAAAQQAAAQRAAADKAAADKVAAAVRQAQAEKQAAAQKAADEKAIADKLAAADKADAERQAAADKAAAEVKAKAVADAKAKAKADADAKAIAEAKAKADAEAKAMAEAKAKADAQAKAVADAKAKADAQAKAVADAKAKADAQAKAVADAKAKADAEAKAVADAKAKADADAKAKIAKAEGIDINALLNKHKSNSKNSQIAAGGPPSTTPSKQTGRAARTSDAVGQTASVGAPDANAPRLKTSDHMAMQAMIDRLVQPYVMRDLSANGGKSVTVLRLHLNPDGTLAGDPEVVSAVNATLTGNAIRAVKRGITPQTPLRYKPELYASWKTIEIEVKPQGA